MSAAIALAASAREWPDHLHRFLLDHGGPHVKARVMGSEQALSVDYEVLLIDDICSFLTPRLVRRLREQGKEIVGVYTPEDGPDAKRRLLECGITDVVESEAIAEEFIHIISTTLEHHRPVQPTIVLASKSDGYRIAVRSAATGSGCTEVAVALAARLASSHSTVLVDMDQGHPGVAQRLDLPLHPNLRTAVDLAHHDEQRLGDVLMRRGPLAVVGGLAVPSPDEPLRPIELIGLLEDLSSFHRAQVIDMGESANAAAIRCPVEVIVGEASPVGLTRLIHLLGSSAANDRIIVVNRSPLGRRHDEIRAHMAEHFPGQPFVQLPSDERVTRAAWDGAIEMRGPFSRAVSSVASLISGSISR